VSIGLRRALGDAFSWIVAAAILLAGVLYHQELKAGLAAAIGVDLAAPTDAPARGGDAAARPAPGTVELRAGANGHFVTTADLNGRPVEVMVDTGASLIALTYEDAERAGIFVRPSDFTHSVSTANGIAKVAPVEIATVAIGDIRVRNVRAAVVERGKLATTLLGMTFLGRLSRTEIRGRTLILQE
jgi:aspartyl protease family protein